MLGGERPAFDRRHDIEHPERDNVLAVREVLVAQPEEILGKLVVVVTG